MLNLLSKNVTVFPIAKDRCAYAPSGRELSEATISNMLRQLLPNDQKGFVISYSENGSYLNIEFNLHGYYFKLENISINNIPENTTGLYACIAIDSETKELIGEDTKSDEAPNSADSYSYQGLKISFTDPGEGSFDELTNIPYDQHTLKLLDISKNAGGGWKFSRPATSFLGNLIGGIDGKPKS